MLHCFIWESRAYLQLLHQDKRATRKKNLVMTKKKLLYLISLLILLIGLSISALILLTAKDSHTPVDGYEFIDGKAYPIMLKDSKRYQRDLELIGGKAAVFADDLNRWFFGLWRGKQLAATLAVLSIVCSFILFRIAKHQSD